MKWFRLFMVLAVIALLPTDAIILWVKYPNPLWLNIILTTMSLFADVFFISSIRLRNETKSIRERMSRKDVR